MDDRAKTKKQLIDELRELRRRLSEMEAEKTESRSLEVFPLAIGQRLDFILQGADLGFWDWDLTTGKALWAEENFRMLGYEPNEVEPDMEHWKRLVHPDDWPRVSERLNLHMEGKLPIYEVDYRIRNKAGDWQWVHGRGKVIEFDANGKPLRMMGVLANATERIQAEEALRESEQQYRSLFEESRDAIYLTARDGTLVEANQAFLDLFGLTREDAQDLNVLTLYRDRADRKRFQAKIERNGSLKDYEVRFQKKDGTQIVCLLTFALRFDKDGNLLGYQGIARDITERKKAEEELRRTSEEFEAVIQAAPVSIIAYDRNSIVRLWNPASEDIFGWSSAEAIGKYLPFVPEDKVEEHLETRERVLRGEQVAGIEAQRKRKDGSTIDLMGSAAPLHDSQGGITGILAVLLDITERKKAERELRESEQRMSQIINFLPDATLAVNRDGQIIAWNRAMEEMTGLLAREMIGKGNYEYALPFYGTRRPILIDLVLTGDENIRRSYSYFRADKQTFTAEAENAGALGKEMTLLAKAGPLFDTHGTLIGAIECIRDITPRKLAEQSLRESEEKYRSVVENMQDVFYQTDLRGNIVLVSPSGPGMIGYESVDEMIGLNIAKDFLKNPEESDRLLATIREKGKVSQYEVELVKKDGSSIMVSTNSHLYCDKSGKPLGFEGVFTDITARKHAEEALRKSEARYRALVEYANEGIFVAQDEVLKSPNRRLAQMAGYEPEEMIGLPFAKFIHPEDADMILGRYKQRVARVPGLPSSYQFRLIRKDGDPLWVELNTAVIEWDGMPATLNMLRDISERKMAEDAILRAERLKAIADLAGGVAHNFNNLLQVVMGGIGLALIDLEIGNVPVLKNTLEQVLETSKFGAETVRRLQSFAQIRADLQPSEKKMFDLSQTVKQSAEMTKPWWKTLPEKEGLKIDLHLNLADGCWMRGSEGEMFEVLVNLVKNAAEALPKGGEIRVKTSVQDDQVVLQVADTGVGIGAENLRKVFQPFWSTKGVAAGTGMGLAVSHGIISRNGGTIAVQSEEGKGTTFTVRFPFAGKPQEVSAPSGEEVFHMRLKFLVVDDMEPIVSLLDSMLTRYGQTVFTAVSGEDALQIFKNNAVDMVICDLAMPGMNGWDVGKAIRTICQERGVTKTPFILLTGWGGQTLEEEKIIEAGVDAVVEKPLDNKMLMAVIKKMVDESSHSKR